MQSDIIRVENKFGAKQVNRLLKCDIRLGIEICQDHLLGAMLWGGPKMCKQNSTIIFRIRRWFSEKPT